MTNHLDPFRRSLIEFLSADDIPPETAALCADLFAANERFNVLVLMARGLYEPLYGPLRSPPSTAGLTTAILLQAGERKAHYWKKLIALSEQRDGYDELHETLVAFLGDLRRLLWPGEQTALGG